MQMQSAFDPKNPNGQFDGIFILCVATVAINKGDVVVMDTAATGNDLGVKVTTTVTAAIITVVGIAMETAAAGGVVRVMWFGVFDNANCAAGIAAGDDLATSTTAGRLGAPAATAVVGGNIGVALAASASNLVKIFVKHG